MSEETTKLLNVAIDDGYAQTKLYGEDENGNIIKTVMRSSVRAGRYGLGDISGQGAKGSYDTEDGPFTVSEDVAAENTQFDNFHLSTMNRVLVTHALVNAGYGGKEVSIMTGLPVADYFTNGMLNTDTTEAKAANLKKPVTLSSGRGQTADIKKVRVGCQAVAAWLDYALNDDLEEREDLNGAVAIIDIGGRTTDIATVVASEGEDPRVDFSRSGTANVGVLDVYRGLQNAIQQKFKIRDIFPARDVDKAVRTGFLPLWGDNEDVRAEVDEVVREHQAAIVREINRHIGSGASLKKIVFVGGGSALFKTIAEGFRNGQMAEDPEFANARGLYKFARYMEA